MVEREAKIDLANMYRLLKPISGAQQVLLDEVQAHIKQQGLEAISGLKGESVSYRDLTEREKEKVCDFDHVSIANISNSRISKTCWDNLYNFFFIFLDGSRIRGKYLGCAP